MMSKEPNKCVREKKTEIHIWEIGKKKSNAK